MSTRLNININETLLAKLRIIAAIDGTTVTDIITNLISDFVDKKKDISQKKISEIFTTARKPDQSSQLQQLISEFAKNNPDAVKIGSDGKKYLKAEPKFGQWLNENNFNYDQAKTKELGYKQRSALKQGNSTSKPRAWMITDNSDLIPTVDIS